MSDSSWTLQGSEGLPIHGNTHLPGGPPRGVAVVVHGFTGHKDRNLVPAVTLDLADAGFIAHRCTLSHAGVERDGDDITRLDEFERDSNAFCAADIRAVVEAIADGTIAGTGLPLVLVGHSRGGATVYRCAAEAEGFDIDGDATPWPMTPAAITSLAATATFTRLSPEMVTELDRKGYVERQCGRAPGGIVRLGRSWYAHHLDHPDRDVFAEAVAAVRCPCLVVHGNDDVSVTPDHADRIMAMLRQNPHASATDVRIDGADHNFNSLGFGTDRENMRNPQIMELYRAMRAFLADVL
ncbi:MAG: alpha/beta fold hydrolase [Planctomycetota bacterium]